MYHSLYFTTEDNTDWASYEPGSPSAKIFNTYVSWGLIANERPVISMPPVKTKFVDQEFVSGSIDNSTILTKVPVYGDRTGSITFYVTEPKNWPDTLLNLSGYLHGKRLKMWLEDDPEYYYIGRWAVNQWGSSEKFSTIQLDYTLYPYKISKLDTLSEETDWLWDDINFDNGRTSLKNEYFLEYAPEDIIIPYPWVKIKTWTCITNFSTVDRRVSQGLVVPIITVSDISDMQTENYISLRFTNQELGIDTSGTFAEGSSMRQDFVFSNLTNSNKLELYIKSAGAKVGLSMRRLMF